MINWYEHKCIISKNAVLREVVAENEQLKGNIDVLYKENKDLNKLNVELCSQIEKMKKAPRNTSAFEKVKNDYE